MVFKILPSPDSSENPFSDCPEALAQGQWVKDCNG